MAANNPNNPSFKTNVNRMKTKRWVEAKSYTYDGDDWGDADEYDEYDGYDEPHPAPAGPSSRQAGGPQQQDPRQQLPPFPGAPPQPVYMQQAPRGSSPGRPPYAQDPHSRSGSFDRGDELRNFSGPLAPGSPGVAPLRTAYGSAPRNQSPMGRGQQRIPISPPHGQAGFPTGRSSMEQQIRGAPGSLPPPAAPFAGADPSARTWSMGSQGSAGATQRRDQSPAGANRTPQQPLTSRLPRKSSLGQDSAPSSAVLQRAVPPEALADQEREYEPSRPAAMASDNPTPKLVRPADIYKRVAEEKERERMSQESGRPSMSDIIRDTPSDSETTSGNSLRPRKHTLDTVAERKSEYGAENLLGQQSAGISKAPPAAEEQRKQFSTSPQLPELTSGFGDDWMTNLAPGADKSQDVAKSHFDAPKDSSARGTDMDRNTVGLGLSHKPSDGLRSVVHQAFDEPVVSATPAGSDVVRSDTTSTSAISPIISRNSSKDHETRNQAIELRAVNMGAIAEEGNIGAPHESGSPSVVKQIDGKAQPTDDLPPPGFIPGHRRNTSIPSPGNSPAQHPKLEVRNVPEDEQDAEFAQTTPFEEKEQRRRAESAAKASQIQNVVESLAQKAREAPVAGASPTRAESPSKGRVRDLVGKAESASSSRRGSESSQTGVRPSQERADSFRPQLPGGWNSYVTNRMSPSPERGASPRAASKSPSRPGTSGDNIPSSLPGAASNPSLLGQGGTTSPTHSTNPNTAKSGMDIEPTTRKRSLVHGEATDNTDSSREPLAAAKAASTALAGAVAGTVGLDSIQNEPFHNQYSGTRGQHAGLETGGTIMYPDSSRPLMPASVDSATTSMNETPGGYSPARSPEDIVPMVAPLRQKPAGAPGTTTAEATAASLPFTQRPMSVSTHATDSPMDENDILRQDIVRHLTPNAPVSNASSSNPSTPVPSHQAVTAPPPVAEERQQPFQQVVPVPAPVTQPKPKKALKHKFSWEAESESEEEEEEVVIDPVQQGPQPAVSSSSAPGPIIAPSATITKVREEFVPELDAAPHTFQSDLQIPAAPAGREEHDTTQELSALRSSSDDEGARKIPDLGEHTAPQLTMPGEVEPLKSPLPPQVPAKDFSEPKSPSDDAQSIEIEQQQFQPRSQGARSRGQTLSAGQVQVPAFREILAMKSPDDRLRVYRSTQETFYNMNTGLTNWMQMMGDKHPEHKPLLNSTGNFAVPTPGLPAPRIPQQGASSTAGSGTGFGGLRKAGAAAAPSMNDAGAALKSAGRDTKKLAKGLFAKGRSKFGRDKGSKLASPPQNYQPYRPGASQPPPQPQAQFTPYRPAQSAFPAASMAPATGMRPAGYSVGIAPGATNVTPQTSAQSVPVQPPNGTPHPTPSQKSLPSLPPGIPAQPSAPRASDVSAQTTGSYDSERYGEIFIAPPPPSEPDMDHFESDEEQDPEPKTRPVLQQRLTIHQKDIKPFEMDFPGDLLGSSAYKDEIAEDSDIPPVSQATTAKNPGTPLEQEGMPEQDTPKQSQFPTRSQSLSAGRTLDPGVEVFNTTPSWLNFAPKGSPATSDFFGLNSPSNNSSKSSPNNLIRSPTSAAKERFRDKRASLPASVKHSSSVKTKPEGSIEEEPAAAIDGIASPEARPFSFISFATRPEEDFSLNEIRVPSRHSSIFTESTGDYGSRRPSERDVLRSEISREEDEYEDEDEDDAHKPLPSLPDEADEADKAKRIAMGGPFYTMPAARTTTEVSLFPQSTSSRPTTGDRKQQSFNDFRPVAPQAQAYTPVQAATMPAGGTGATRHKRAFSGANLLQRALTAGINAVEGPKRDRSVIKAEKTDKKRRRFSGLNNLLGKPKANRRVPIEDPTPPGTSRATGALGITGLADNARAFENGRQGPLEPIVQYPNAPDPIHVAPIEGYYSPEGDATQSPMASPIPSTHIASQFDHRLSRSPQPSAVTSSPASRAAPYSPLAPPESQTIPQDNVKPNQSVFNETSQMLRHVQEIPYQQDAQHSPQQGPHIYQPYTKPTILSPPTSPPTTQLPQIPQPPNPKRITIQREATVSRTNTPESPARLIDPEQLKPKQPLFSHPHPAGASSLSISERSHTPLDRRSIDAFPRPPSSSRSHASQSRSYSPSTQFSASNQLHPEPTSPGGSVATSAARRSRGPSLLVDTNLANGGSGSSSRGSDVKRVAQPLHTDGSQFTLDSEADDVIASGLSALGGFEQMPASAAHAGESSTSAWASSATPGTASATPGGDVSGGLARKMTIQPATLRRMRQREIELGGETRLNSPAVARPGSADSMPVPMPLPLAVPVVGRVVVIGGGGDGKSKAKDVEGEKEKDKDKDKNEGREKEKKKEEEEEAEKDSAGGSKETEKKENVEEDEKVEKTAKEEEEDEIAAMEREWREAAEAKEVLSPGAGTVVGKNTHLKPKEDSDEEHIVMSATSFPGQEWNPYEGGY